MSSILGLSQPIDPNPDAEPSQSIAPGSAAKRLSAVLISGIIPGAGHMLLGHLRAGTLFLAGFAAALALFWPLRLLQWYLGFCVSVLLLATVTIAAAWHVARSAHERLPKLSPWWLLVILPLAYLGSNFDADRMLRVAGFQVFNIPSSAMANTLIIGDRIVVDRRYYATHLPRVGDIAVFRREPLWEVKRIVALGGDTIYGRAGRVYRNGDLLYEPYVQHAHPTTMAYMNDFGPVTLSAGQIFVMGDNRDVSFDSRQPAHGPISLNSQSGRPLYIIWSPNRRRTGKSLR